MDSTSRIYLVLTDTGEDTNWFHADTGIFLDEIEAIDLAYAKYDILENSGMVVANPAGDWDEEKTDDTIKSFKRSREEFRDDEWRRNLMEHM